jgi:hypothetical protein
MNEVQEIADLKKRVRILEGLVITLWAKVGHHDEKFLRTYRKIEKASSEEAMINLEKDHPELDFTFLPPKKQSK